MQRTVQFRAAGEFHRDRNLEHCGFDLRPSFYAHHDKSCGSWRGYQFSRTFLQGANYRAVIG